MKTFAAITLFASVALAQSALPTGVSPKCGDFLTALDKDAGLKTCTSALVDATSAFSPSKVSSASKTTVGSSINSVCASSSSCQESTIRAKLADFYTACGAELGSNKDVTLIFDMLYTIAPFTKALCAKAEDSSSCLSKIGASSKPAAGLLSHIAADGADNKQTPVAVSPNATTFADNNLLFLTLSPDMDADALCTSCTRSALTVYVNWQTSSPYSAGLAKSALLSHQAALYAAVQQKCGAQFLSGGVAAAAGLSGGVLGDQTSKKNGAARMAVSGSGAVALLGSVALAMAL